MRVRTSSNGTPSHTNHPIPTPVPTAGIPAWRIPPFVHRPFVEVCLLCGIPDIGRFFLLTQASGLRVSYRPCSPKTSLIAHAKTSSPTDGLTTKGHACPLEKPTSFDGYGRQRVPAKDLRAFCALRASASPPTPFRRRPSGTAKHPKTLAGDGRASQRGKCSQTRTSRARSQGAAHMG